MLTLKVLGQFSLTVESTFAYRTVVGKSLHIVTFFGITFQCFKIYIFYFDNALSEICMRVRHSVCKALNTQVVKIHVVEMEEEEMSFVHRLAVLEPVDVCLELLTDLSINCL